MRFSSLIVIVLLANPGSLTAQATESDAPDRIIFSHVAHAEDMGLECSECHEGLETSMELSHDLLPVMDQCFACHDGDTAPEECSACHTRPDEPTTYNWQTSPGLLFPHQTHLAKEIECSQCHPAIASSEALAPRTPPKMESCMDCHSPPLTDAGCSACHSSLEGKLPAGHGTDWPEVHGLYTQDDTGGECSICHQQTDCESCHAQAQIEKKVHPANYEFLHAGEFFGFEKECSTCHAVPQECVSCHRMINVMPVSHNSILWANPTNGGFHQDEVLDKPDYCVVCHEPAVDATCIRAGCHAE